MSGKVEMQGVVYNAKLINEFLTKLECEPDPRNQSISSMSAAEKSAAENRAQKCLCRIMRKIDKPGEGEKDLDNDNGKLTDDDRKVWKRWIKRAKSLDEVLQPPADSDDRGTKLVREAGVFQKLIEQWPLPQRMLWIDLFEETSSLRMRLREFVIAFDAFQQAAPQPILRVFTTPLLAYRFWPVISRKFHALQHGNEPMPINVIRGEPVDLIRLARQDGDYDVIVTYGDCELVRSIDTTRITFPETTESHKTNELSRQHAEFHRCLLLPAGTCRGVWSATTPPPRIDNRIDLQKLVGGKSVAVIRNFELIYGQKLTNELLQAGARLVHFNQTLELHTFVRASSGPCVSHIEALGETDAKALDSIELDPEVFGRSSLLVVSSTEIRKGRGAKAGSSATLLKILKHKAKEDFENYAIANEVTKWLSSFPNCYCTSLSLMEKQGGKKGTDSEFKEFHWWRGRANVRVTPGLWISGDYELFGIDGQNAKGEHDRSFKYKAAEQPMTFRLFGRVARLSKQKDEEWQMTLRGTADSAEIFQSFFVLGSLTNSPDCIIGHWIGRMDQGDHKGPDAGTWIWHKSKNLPVCALNEMMSEYSKQFPLCLTPGISNVLGKGKPVEPSILYGSSDITR